MSNSSPKESSSEGCILNRLFIFVVYSTTISSFLRISYRISDYTRFMWVNRYSTADRIPSLELAPSSIYSALLTIMHS